MGGMTMIRIAVDVYGGDNAPGCVIDGSLNAILFTQKSAESGGGAGSCAPARPLWGAVPWTHVGAAVLLSFTPRQPPRQILHRTVFRYPGRVSGGARKSVLSLPHHIPPQVQASTSLFLDSLLGLPQQSGTCSVSRQNWSGLAHGEL